MDRRFCLYDVEESREVASVQQSANVNVVAFSSRLPLVACGGHDGTVTVWEMLVEDDRVELVKLHTMRASPRAVWRLQFNSDDSLLLWGGESKEVYVGNVASGENKSSIPGNHWAVCTTFSSDGRRLVTDSSMPQVMIWDAQTVEPVRSLDGHDANLTAVAADPTSSVIASADSGAMIKSWDFSTGDELASVRTTSPYIGMNITDVTGLTDGQFRALMELGAVVD